MLTRVFFLPQMVRCMVARLDNPGHPPLIFCEYHCTLPKNSAPSSSQKSPRYRKEQVFELCKGLKPRARTTYILPRHDSDLQKTPPQHFLHVQQLGCSVLFHGLHALLDLHAQIHRDSVQAVSVVFCLHHWNCGSSLQCFWDSAGGFSYFQV